MTPALRRTLVGLVAASILFAASCGGGEQADAPVEAALVASTVSGEQINFGSFEGRDVVLWFWAPW